MAPTPLQERVAAARKAAGLSQFEVAHLSGVSLSVVRNIEQGITKDPHLSTLRSLVQVLPALDVGDLLDPAEVTCP